MTPPDAWERQPYDTEESWRAFQAYRDRLPRSRSVVLDGRAIDPIKVARWMATHFWQERCYEYDRHLDSFRLAEIESMHAQTGREIAAEHKAVTSLGRAIAMREMAKLREAVEKSAVEVLKPRDLIRLVESIVKLDRLVLGESTENVEVRDLSSLTDAELDEIERIASREQPTSH